MDDDRDIDVRYIFVQFGKGMEGTFNVLAIIKPKSRRKKDSY